MVFTRRSVRREYFDRTMLVHVCGDSTELFTPKLSHCIFCEQKYELGHIIFYKIPWASSKDSNQLAHSPKDSLYYLLPAEVLRWCWLDWVDAQTELILCWAHRQTCRNFYAPNHIENRLKQSFSESSCSALADILWSQTLHSTHSDCAG